MQIREGVEADAADFRWVARTSLQAAYHDSVSPETIDSAVDRWYADEEVAERLDDSTYHYLVAEGEPGVLGLIEYSVSDAAEEGTIQWVHVDPEYWGEGIGDDLLDAAEEALFDRGVTRIEASALEENADAIDMFDLHDYIEGASQETTIGDESFAEKTYLKFAPGEEPRLIDSRETEVGTFYIALDEHKVGSLGDFYVAYRDEEREARYGFYCDNCASVDASMDSMGRVQCNDCGNTAKPTRWDAAYL